MALPRTVDTPERLFSGATPTHAPSRQISPGSTPRGQKLADWQATPSPRSGGSGGGKRRGGQQQTKRHQSGLRNKRNISVVSDSSSSSSDSDSDSDDDVGDSDAQDEAQRQADKMDATTSPLQTADDVAAAMRKGRRNRQRMSFDAEWEDVYLADELRAAQRERHPELSNDGLPPDWVVFLGVAILAVLMGLAAHFLLKHNGYHDLEHEDIRDLEL
jgi:hypothetical protein